VNQIVNIESTPQHLQYHYDGRELSYLIAPHSGESHKQGRLLASTLEYVGSGNVAKRLGQFKVSMRPVSTSMNHTLRNPLMIEMHNLLSENHVLHQEGTKGGITSTHETEGILVVRHRHTQLSRHGLVTIVSGLMRGPAGTQIQINITHLYAITTTNKLTIEFSVDAAKLIVLKHRATGIKK
jgi:hypothetical protein